MMRPVTCLSLMIALSAGLYLYQEKHTAQLLDRDITRTVKQAEAGRDRIGLLKAEWALLNEPERLQGLAVQHLQLQSLAPAQFARLEDLPGRLPAPSAVPVNVAPVEDTPAAPPLPSAPIRAQSVPMAQTAPAAVQPRPAAIVQAARAPVPVSVPVALAQAVPPPIMSAPVAAPRPAAPLAAPLAAPAAVQLAAAKPTPKPLPAPAAPHMLAAAKPAPEPTPAPRPFYAPVMPAYAPTPVIIHAPTVQTASAMEQRPAPFPTPFVGSALGMARTMLAAPVPVGSVPVASVPVASSYATR